MPSVSAFKPRDRSLRVTCYDRIPAICVALKVLRADCYGSDHDVFEIEIRQDIRQHRHQHLSSSQHRPSHLAVLDLLHHFEPVTLSESMCSVSVPACPCHPVPLPRACSARRRRGTASRKPLCHAPYRDARRRAAGAASSIGAAPSHAVSAPALQIPRTPGRLTSF